MAAKAAVNKIAARANLVAASNSVHLKVECGVPTETAEVVPATGLAASTRAYAKIITDVNGLDLKDLVRPQTTQARR